ncbi:MAG: AAA family ATPase [Cyanobacteria bacterium P01_D01_bin.71]
MNPKLYIFSGLPGTGKTTLAKRLSEKIKAAYLRVDTIEQGIRDLCSFEVEGEGYGLAYRIASDNLLVGNNVVSDSVNPIEVTRNEWEQVANNASAEFINIEILCSDKQEHKHRIETRDADIQNLFLPSWKKVQERTFEVWNKERIIIDTAGSSVEQSLSALIQKIANVY